ncbi:MAG: heparinase II/III family protein [Pirellulales bacterium]|nr:heparinase II/III family protein [Pirellulales bacterium]
MNALRYYYTLRDLKPVQIYGRVWQRLIQPRPDDRPAPPLRPRTGRWLPPARHAPAMTGPRRFRFLGEERELDWPSSWNDPAIHKLWLFNLQYFADLASDDAHHRADWHRALIARWIADTRPFVGHAWVPYCTSQRIINWIKWLLAGNEPVPGMLDSLALQIRYLEQRLEHHVQGNHLLANAVALAFAGVFFNAREGDRWLATALTLLRAQVVEQVLADGGHYELSPMYHALVLEHLLDVANLAQAYSAAIPEATTPVAGWSERIAAMVRWLQTMTFPDGQIALLSDSAWEIAATTAELGDYASRLGFRLPPLAEGPVTPLADSGYVRLQQGPAVLIADVGPLGARYQAGHGHADVLSFELALAGQRVIVDTGTSVYYGNSLARLQERGTAAHNTVTVDGANSSEVWDNFRVARRARPRDLFIGQPRTQGEDDALVVSCAHDGYLRLPGRVLHRRTWRLTSEALEIEDRLDGRFETAVARFHFDPAIQLVSQAADGCKFRVPGWSIELVTRGCRLKLERSAYHPRFGTSHDNLCIAAELLGPLARFRYSWTAG